LFRENLKGNEVKTDDLQKCVANERENPVMDQRRGILATTSGPFEEYVVKEI